MPDKEAPKTIWITLNSYVRQTKMRDNDTKYVRADTFHACMEAGCSLNYHLFEIQSSLIAGATVDALKDLIIDAQLALDKWNRFLEEEE